MAMVRLQLASIAAQFAAAGIDSARLDAEVLMAAVLGGRHRLWTDAERALDEGEQRRLDAMVEKRLDRLPVAYILGRKEFWSLELAVGPSVLVPRPETELLVEKALSCLRSSSVNTPCRRVLDVGTGSGAIAIAIKHEWPAARVTALDASADALAFAKKNAAACQVDLHFVEVAFSDYLRARQPAAQSSAQEDERFSLIVSNPPYIPSADIAGLAQEVQKEPLLALDGGPDGLDVIRELIGGAPALLAPGGWLGLEIGAGQAQAVSAMAQAAQAKSRESGASGQPVWSKVVIYRDLAGIERVVFAQRS